MSTSSESEQVTSIFSLQSHPDSNSTQCSDSPVVNTLTPSMMVWGARAAILMSTGLGSFRTLSVYQPNDFFQAPNMISNARLHCWRDTQALMNAGSVLI